MGNTSLFTSADVRWTFQPALLHNNRGKNIELSQTRHNTVATRVRRYDYGIVCTSEPVAIGLMFKVTVLEKDSQGDGGLVSFCLSGEIMFLLKVHHDADTVKCLSIGYASMNLLISEAADDVI